MFKEATIYRISGLPSYTPGLAENLRKETFHPTTSTQQKASGWEPPRAAHGDLVEYVGGQWIARHTTETRTVPADALQEKTDEEVRKIEHRDGRKVGKRERRDIKDQALMALLPQAFPRQSSVPVWIDPIAGLLIIGTASQAKADAIVTSLVRTSAGDNGQCALQLRQLHTKTNPAAAMAAWIDDDEALPSEFSVGRECELRGTGEQPPVLRYNRYDVANSQEVREHVRRAMVPTRLALDWTGVAAFVLTSTLTLRKIEVAEVQTLDADAESDAFDADVALTTGTLAPCIQDLLAALGGEADEQPL